MEGGFETHLSLPRNLALSFEDRSSTKKSWNTSTASS